MQAEAQRRLQEQQQQDSADLAKSQPAVERPPVKTEPEQQLARPGVILKKAVPEVLPELDDIHGDALVDSSFLDSLCGRLSTKCAIFLAVTLVGVGAYKKVAAGARMPTRKISGNIMSDI